MAKKDNDDCFHAGEECEYPANCECECDDCMAAFDKARYGEEPDYDDCPQDDPEPTYESKRREWAGVDGPGGY